MLKEFLSRIGIKSSRLKRSETVFSVPCGASARLKADYAALAEECGLKKVRFVEVPFLAALGADAVLSESNPVFCLDIGGGVTNVAVLSLDGIIAGLSMNIGGNNMDANVIARIEECKGLRIGALSAERVKNEIGSLAVGRARHDGGGGQSFRHPASRFRGGSGVRNRAVHPRLYRQVWNTFPWCSKNCPRRWLPPSIRTECICRAGWRRSLSSPNISPKISICAPMSATSRSLPS